tara:strand:- start:298 stop:816 length:519 start_codon:yes stop_codon:yes gene_type:complete
MKILLLINILSLVSSFLSKNTYSNKYRLHIVKSKYIEWSFDEYEDDIQLLDHDEAKEILEAWGLLSTWKKQEIQKYIHIINTDNPDDIFIGYTPSHDSMRKLIYLFHSKLSVKDTGPYLTILSGICCPHDNTLFQSIQFKKTLERQLNIIPIDFTPLGNDPRFGLSWSLDDD